MVDNPFERAMGERQAEELQEAEVLQRIIEASSDFEGSRLEEYFKQDDVALCEDFLRVVRQRNGSGIPLKLEVTDHILTDQDELRHGSDSIEHKTIPKVKFSIGQHAGITKKVHVPPPRVQKEALRRTWKTVWTGEGFRIGKAHIPTPTYSGDINLYLCTDGRLRCDRGDSFKGLTTSHGTGTLPTGSHIDVGTFSSDEETGYESMRRQPLESVLLSVFPKHSSKSDNTPAPYLRYDEDTMPPYLKDL